MILLKWLVFDKVGRLVGLALVALLIVGGIWAKGYYSGKSKGIDQQKDVEKVDLQTSRESDRASTGQSVAAVDQRISADSRVAKDANARAEGWQIIANQLLKEKRDLDAKLAAMADSELHGANVSLLGDIPGQACYSPGAERRINRSLTQLPVCEKQVETLNAKDGDRLKEIAALNQQIGALEERDRIKDELRKRDDERWAQLWNLNPPKQRAWKCLKAWKCGTRKLSVTPAPQP